MAAALNDAAVEYFRAARRENAGTASELRDWSARVANAAGGLLAALAVDAADHPAPFALASLAALCVRPDGDIYTKFPPAPLGLPAGRVEGLPARLEVLQATTNGVWLLRHLALGAADYHASKIVPDAPRARRKGLSARQGFLLLLACIFRASFAVPPIAQHSNDGPFVRFAIHAYGIVAKRVVAPKVEIERARKEHRKPKPMGPVTMGERSMDPGEQDAPFDDGADYKAAEVLGECNKRAIADDLRNRVWSALKSTAPRTPKGGKISRRK